MSRRLPSLIISGTSASDGAGVKLNRIFAHRHVNQFDPFLLLDGFDTTNPDDYLRGFPWHPHRGIETVTYLISGSVEHSDSLGNKGIIGDLSCQWMTAGSGIIHQEMPLKSERLLGCQLWVNLPKKDKMCHPQYNDLLPQQIPLLETNGARIRVISGSYQNVEGALSNNYVGVQYLDVDLNPNEEWSYHETPDDQTLFVYIFEGSLALDPHLNAFEPKTTAILTETETHDESNCSELIVKAGIDGARFIVVAARPLKEPVAWGGPIVMNTQEELNQAFREIDEGNFIKHH